MNDIGHAFVTSLAAIAAVAAWVTALDALRVARRIERAVHDLQTRPTVNRVQHYDIPQGMITADISLSDADVERIRQAFASAQGRPVPPWGTPGTPPTGTGEEGRTTTEADAVARAVADIQDAVMNGDMTVNQARRAAGLPHYPDHTHLRRRY